MSSFAAIMAMSKAKTEANNAEVQAAIQRREEGKKAAREAAEKKEREERERLEKLRKAQAEQERRQKEKERLRELAAQEKVKEAERKQQAQMQKLLGKARHSAFENRDKEAAATRSKKRKEGSDDEAEGYSGTTLTREEKRALKMDPDARPAWAQKLVGVGSSGRSSSAHAAHSPGKSKRSSSNQVNFSRVLDAPSALATQGDQSLRIKERLKQSDYFVPIKLSSVKRDTRTQADYFQEKRQRALAAKGDSYADWTNPKSEGGSGSDTKIKSQSTSGSRVLLPAGSSGRAKPSTSSSRNDSPSGSRKRRRSESISSSDLDSDYSRKRPKPRSALSSQIWQIVTGKDRSGYNDDVFSDEDEDMEVSMAEVAREEARALKAAQREDQIALEDEMRHEAEKKKKRLMREKERD